MTRTNEAIALTKREYKRIAKKVRDKEIDRIDDLGANIYFKLGAVAAIAEVIDNLESALFQEEEK